MTAVLVTALEAVPFVTQQPVKCAGPLTHAQVVRLLKENLDQRWVLHFVDTCGVNFERTPERESLLRAVNASDQVPEAIRTAIRKQSEGAPLRASPAELATWELVGESRDARLLEGFLAKYPEGAFGALPRRRIADVRRSEEEEADWKAVKDSADEAVLERSLKVNPTGLRAAAAKERLSRLRSEEAEAAAWEVIKGTSDASLLQAFLSRYPAGSHAQLAKASLREVAAAAAWEKVRTTRLGSELRAFLANFGSSPVATAVLLRLDDIVGLTWVRIPPGTFAMECSAGDADCREDERFSHDLTLPLAFQMLASEVTNGEYRNLGLTPPDQDCEPADENRPVVRVTWNEAELFCRAVGARPPTEADWKYAARGGVPNQRYVWGQTKTPVLNGRPAANVANESYKSRSHWSSAPRIFKGYDDGFGSLAPVRSFAPNAFGLFDMAGNVAEWVQDWYNFTYYRTSILSDPKRPPSGTGRVNRGGSMDDEARYLRVSSREQSGQAVRSGYVGFRCVRVL